MANSIKQNTQQGEKKEQRRRTSLKHKNKTQNASQKGIGTNHVLHNPNQL